VIFSIAIVMLGLSAASRHLGRAQRPAQAMVAAACSGRPGSRGRARHRSGQLWLVYLGYGVIGGIGLGIGYISPVSTLIKWFPDRPGLATGLAIMGFGGGALIASPLSARLLALYDSGYDASDPASIASGAAVASLFVTLGIVYLAYMLFGAFTVRVPADDWRPRVGNRRRPSRRSWSPRPASPPPTRSRPGSSISCGSSCSAT
jgi:MFS family permease